ncbi:hypothetical protein CNBE1820 [Paecilomyces variotii No. 5]|uniref:Transcription factor domain-containing protein n=1 Tax=Byssochlamys spectabilis (strain No. 5 / NBRC 109023) TaxID=1356009 RepID=V5FPQ8_BYSSN|nr:hypothetical protein CNBE1820 [Paecilomyces variotii No. 5]
MPVPELELQDTFRDTGGLQFADQTPTLSRSSISERGGGSVASPTHQLRYSNLAQPYIGARGPDRQGLDFANLDLVSIADSTQIRNRWLETFLPSDNQIPKTFLPYTVQFLSCVLGSYPKYMLRDACVPPIIHGLQVDTNELPLALANCYSLVRMWETRAAGSEAIVTSTVQREMERLIEEVFVTKCRIILHCTDVEFQRESYGHMELLAASQAYLIYAIMAYFSPAQGVQLVDSSTIIHLQEFSSRLALGGLIPAAELIHTRPSWESWIVGSAKMRVIFATYMFNNIFNSTNQVPVYLAEELGDLPVPGNKLLWEAKDRITWEKEYDRHLSLWEDGNLRIFELWRSPETGSPNRRKRIQQWLRSVDEFGMMLFATCAHLHGC